MTPDWIAALAEYAASMAAVEPLTEAQLRRVVDAKGQLDLMHHAVLLRSLERAKKCAVRT